MDAFGISVCQSAKSPYRSRTQPFLSGRARSEISSNQLLSLPSILQIEKLRHH